ncbi:hypothetical protein T492DRAFT_871094, partial [Pavlovales sp. CCMP2436]
ESDDAPLPAGLVQFALDSPLNNPRAPLPAAPESSGEHAPAEAAPSAAIVTGALLCFSLASGSYATVALREVITSDRDACAAGGVAPGWTPGAIPAGGGMGSRHLRFESSDDEAADGGS